MRADLDGNTIGTIDELLDLSEDLLAPLEVLGHHPGDLYLQTQPVDFADLLEVLGSWGACGGCDEDFDGNGVVGFDDLLNLLSKWGAC